MGPFDFNEKSLGKVGVASGIILGCGSLFYQYLLVCPPTYSFIKDVKSYFVLGPQVSIYLLFNKFGLLDV